MKGKGLALLLSPGEQEKAAKKGDDSDEEMDMGGELEDAMGDLIDAIKAEDPKAAALAFQRAMEC